MNKFGEPGTPPVSPLCKGGSRGFILIIALAMMSVLAVLSMEYAHLARSSADRTRAGMDNLSAFYAAESGVERARVKLAGDSGPPDTLTEGWRDPAGYSAEIGGWTVSVKVTDEGGKINLNSAEQEVLSALFEQFEMQKQERDILTGSLLDWIDSNDLHRLNGVESNYYKSNGFPYGAKNAPLDLIDEILRVRGAPPDLMDRRAKYQSAAGSHSNYTFAECVTVVGDTRVNINTAAPPVLRAIGLTAAEVRVILAARAKKPWGNVLDISPLLGEARYAYLNPRLKTGSSWFLIESAAARRGFDPVTVYALVRRASKKIYVAGFWT